MAGTIVRLHIAANGQGYGVFDGGTNSDPGSQSLFPAIPFAEFLGATGWCDDPTHDKGPATPLIGVQDRGGWLFIKATGAAPGVSTAVAYVTY